MGLNIPVILGMTATGKTDIGIALAKLIDGEIISVDSRKVYAGLTIGTAVPDGTWDKNVLVVDGIAHHLIQHLKPDQPYNAGDFAQDAETLIDQILARGKTPLLVGGTGFYFKALHMGLPQLPPRDNTLRANLMKRLEKEGSDMLHDELKRNDPTAAAAISHNDSHKIVRALEVTALTGRPFSSWKKTEKNKSKHSFFIMGLDMDKEKLEQKIELRSKKMLERGMIDETQAVLKQGYAPTCPALTSFGYKEAVQVLEGKLTKSEFLPLLIKGTKAYAKRQRTWFRTQTKPTHWLHLKPSQDFNETASKIEHLLYCQK